MAFKRIIRSIGEYGEHYLARTPGEALHVFGSGGGAGAITMSTVLVKFAIVWMKLPHLAEAALCWVNYSCSFLLMQVLGYRLATKQPALLAVTLVHSRLRRRWAAIVRSQLAATLGNFCFVVVAMAAFHLLYQALAGHPFLAPEAAAHAIESLDPFRTPTVAYAALTGCFLWCASLVAGWAKAHSRSAAGVGFNVSLAVLLSAAPFAGKAFGWKLDVRHFTLSSGALTLGVCELGWSAAWSHGLFHAAVGIVLIALMNFGVSFALSLVAALGTEA